MRYLLLSFVTTIILIQHSAYAQHKFVIVANAFNNKAYYKQHIDSIAHQEYPHYRVVYCDDCSPDSSGSLARNYIASLPNRHLFTFVQNTLRRGQLANTYDAVHAADDDEIIVIVDADDQLIDNRTLAYLDFIYSKKNLWMSYGQFKFITSTIHDRHYNKNGFAVPYPPTVLSNRSFRYYPSYLLSHPRTYYAWLFKLIKLEDLLYNNYFYLAATDPATMFPLAEMAVDHLAALDKVLYAYTYHGGPSEAQIAMLEHIRKRKVYPKIKQPVFNTFSLKKSVSCILNAQNLSYKPLEQFLQEVIKSCQAGQLLNTMYILDSKFTKTEKEFLSNKYKNNLMLTWISATHLVKQILRYDTAHYIWLIPENILSAGSSGFPISLHSCATYLKHSLADGCLVSHSSISSVLNNKRALAAGVYALDQEISKTSSHTCSLIITKKFLQNQKALATSLDKLVSHVVSSNNVSNTFWLYFSYSQAKKASLSHIVTWKR